MPVSGSGRGVRVEPFFLDTDAGRLFAVHHMPSDAARTRGQVLVVAPFNEEMNRCRSMVTLQARALSALGLGVLVIDLFGTGDSQGEHGDARWATWLANLRAAHDWLQSRPGAIHAMLGIRMGCLLAAQLHQELELSNTALVFWQPVVDGKTHLTQFLRVRMAAALDRAEVAKETPSTMRQQFAAGQSVEVAGYEIHPELAHAIDAARLADRIPGASTPSLWLELAATDALGVSVPLQAAADAWAVKGVVPTLQAYGGPPFWQVHERVVTPSIIDATTAWLQARSSAA